MKILQVCSAETIGGGERHVMDLTRALIERGHELHLAVRAQSPLIEALKGLPITWHELGLRNALDVISAQQLATIIRREKIDVMHAHVGRDYTFCGIAARMARPVQFFLTRHHFNPIKSNAVYSWTLKEAAALIAVSESVREQLLAAFPEFADKITVIPNWLDTRGDRMLGREEAREALGITRRLAVGIIGQLTPLKRQDLFIRAAANLIKERHWTDADFLIIGEPGPSDEEYAQKLEATVAELGVSSHVRFTGYVEDFPAHLPALDIVIAPSQNEAFSLALVEAMAAGCAVIATRVGGMADIVKDGVTGIFIEKDDLWALIAGLSRLLSDKALREKIGHAAKESAIGRYDRKNVIDRIELLYFNGGFEGLTETNL
ncbi:MAG: glycosyltransferase family 4 protein [Acidobacteria bacterium]|nr:glycosyltransferase family 4 protein [Acidobacteriota bacterium]